MLSIPDFRHLQGFTYLALPDAVDLRRPTLLFLHGSGHSASFWARQLASLTDVANCLALDLPGHGRSAAPAPASVADRVLSHSESHLLRS